MGKVCFVAANRFGIKAPADIESVTMRDAELIVVYGGDGTILRTVGQMSRMGLLDTPLLGINKGTVGFMAEDFGETNDEGYSRLISDVITALHGGSLEYSHRSLLEVEGEDGYIHRALNELMVAPKDLGKLLEVEMSVKTKSDVNRHSISMKGDGVIIATSTGSTAYNLSAGGPIIMPHMDVMIVTPLNPFTMAARPIVLSADDDIILTTQKKSRIVIDGQEIKQSRQMKIKVSDKKLKLLRGSSFFNAIQEKLGWNRSIK